MRTNSSASVGRRTVVAAGVFLLLLAVGCGGDDPLAGVPAELAQAALVTMEGDYILTVTILDEDGNTQEELEIHRVGVDHVRRISSTDAVREVIAVEHTAYTQDPEDPERYLRNEVSSPTTLDPAYVILDNLALAVDLRTADGGYRFRLQGEEVGGEVDVTARITEGRIVEMSVATARGRSVFSFEYDNVPPIEPPPSDRTVRATPPPGQHPQ